MLDEISLNKQLSLSSCSELFLKEIDILHTTSLIPFPVFINSKNYMAIHQALVIVCLEN